MNLLKRIIPKVFEATEKSIKQVSYKSKDEIVTSSDLYIEKEIIRSILEEFPNDRFFSEEFHKDSSLEDRTWLIDPIDGTSNYAHGLDMFVVQVALYDHNDFVLSYIYAPRINKTFTAIKGEGAYLNEERIHTEKDTTSPNRLFSLVGITHQSDNDKSMFQEMIQFSQRNKIKLRMLGTMGFEMAHLAQGAFSLLYTDVYNPWDIAPGIVLVKEAGGIISNEFGEPYKIGDTHLFAFANQVVMNEVIQSINNKI
ncbi:MAG: inositol monophosphatase [Candidatus Izemoplasmatales bacterium]